jgi:signal transduction histidine kinase/CheY-like chemotaxis protein
MGLIALPGLHLEFANPALEDLLARPGSVPAERHSFAHPPFQQTIARCLAVQADACTPCPRKLGIWHFLPVVENGRTCALQCYVLPMPEAPAAAERIPPDGFEAFLDQLPQQAWIATPRGEIAWINQALMRYAFDHTQRANLGEPTWVDLVHPDDLADVNASLSRALITEEPSGYQLRLRRHDGRYLRHFSALEPVKNKRGEVLYWVGSNINLESVKLGEDRLREQFDLLKHKQHLLQDELRQAQTYLARAQKMDLVSNLSAGVAHDLNNLLFVTGLHAGLLEKNLADHRQREHVEVIHETIKKAGRLASHLTGFSSRRPLSLEAADPKVLVRDIEDLLAKAVGAETALQIHMQENLWSIRTDRMYFENSLINLAINARDAVGGSGHITLRLENTVLDHPDTHTRGDYVHICLSDNGTGMSDEIKARIFEPFFTTKAEGKGVGLGLPMVKNFVDQSGGLIAVDSAEGRGTSFHLYLPRAGQAAQAPREEEALAEGAMETILIIEDDLSVRNAMAQVLYELDYQVVTAYNPEVAMRYILGGMEVDLIISDIRMPGRLTAMEMRGQLLAEGLLTPMLFTTGYSSEHLKEQIPALEGSTVLFKPFSMLDLASAVHGILRQELGTKNSLKRFAPTS